MSFGDPRFLWLALLALPELLLAWRRTAKLRPSLETLVGPRERSRAAARFSSLSLVAAVSSALFVCMAALALAAPAWGREGRATERSGLEVALVLDVSRSMESRDGSPTRLDEAKGLLRSLFRELPSLRAGGEGVSFSLVAAKGDAVLLAPMTEDLEAIDLALDYARPETMTAKGTDLGRGIDAGLDSFSVQGSANRLLVLLSDGGDLAGRARAAAERARKSKVRFAAVGLGGNTPAFVPDALDESGRPATSALDAAALRSLAAVAGGRYLEGAESSTLGALASEIGSARVSGSRIEYEAEDRSGLFAALALAFLVGAAAAGTAATRGGRR